MREFVDAIAPFVYVFAVGYFAYPVWNILKKIRGAAQKHKKEQQ
jgi:hypothetical protein